MSGVDTGTDADAGIDHEVVLLATGFAVGDLEETELRRLYELLRRPGGEGARAARIAWQVLGTTVDLRASLSQRFQDTVALKVAGAATPDRDRGFLAGLFARLGRRRASLAPLDPAPGLEVRRISALLIMAAILILALVLAWWWRQGHSGWASVVAVSGEPRAAGTPLHRGDRLGSGILVLGPGARLESRWDAGHHLILGGPAAAVPNAEGHLSLTEGRCELEAAERFLLELPDRRLELSAGSRALVEVAGGRSWIVLRAGSARVAELTLMADEVLGAGDRRYRWQGDEALRLSERHVGLRADPAADRWRLAATLHFRSLADQVRIAGDGGVLIIEPGRVLLEQGSGAQLLAELSGPPLRERHLTCATDPLGRPSLRLSGLNGELPLPASTAVLDLHASGEAALSAVSFQSGPPDW